MLFDRFDVIRVINLPYRTDRRADMIAELRRVGLHGDPRVAFFDAIAPDDAGTFTSKGAHGVYRSHLAILEEAAAAGRSVLILEDDVDFASGVRDFVLPERWSIFYGAHYASDPADLHNSDIIGAHFMGFSAEAARRIAPYLRAILASGDHPPIDGAYVWFRRAHPDVATVFADPALAEQRSSRTDIADLRWFDRSPGLRQGVSLARRVKRALRRRKP